MSLHLIKLAVGADSFAELALWQQRRLQEKAAKKQKPELIHITRHRPKRADELLDGGSIYWVVKGFIAGRQRLVDLRNVMRDGVPHCGLVYDADLIPVALRPCRAFQGWRYLEAKDAPRDQMSRAGDVALPEALKRELTALGLL